jgi:gas vesicle protein
MAKTRDRVSDAADTVKPYVDRALHDQDLRENVRNAFESARAVYNELMRGRGPVAVGTRVATDKDVQRELKKIVDELREAADRVQGRREHAARNSSLLLVGIVLGLLFNPLTGQQTRKWLSDHVFGGGDEFTYQGGGNGAGTSS